VDQTESDAAELGPTTQRGRIARDLRRRITNKDFTQIV
jgi:hypothetical protein